MTADAVRQAIDTLQQQGRPVSSRNVNRLLRRTPPRYMGRSYRDLLPLLKWYMLPADARQAIRTLDAATEAAREWTGDRAPLIIRGEHAKDVVMAIQSREAAAGHHIDLFQTSLERWSAASSYLIWKGARPW